MSKETKAILIDLIHPRMRKEHAMERMEELEELVRTYGGIVIVKAYQKRFAPHPKTFIGTGKVKELSEEAKKIDASLLIINDILKPRQTYAISEGIKESGMQVWDRVDLILKIFAKHARTTEAKLEIELASIRHMGPRIFGMGMELSRQGGTGTVRGQGETNTEIMKRHLAKKERIIKEKLKKYQRVREGHQGNRRRQGLKTAALVGYTNAGKTTLLNALTGRKEYAANALFATLDTRVGKVWLPAQEQELLVSDTIGFIRDLPPELLNAFSSTLSEALDADLLLHVVDASDKNALKHMDVVDEILERLGAGEMKRMIVVNKIDALRPELEAQIRHRADERPVVQVSAKTGEGIEHFIDALGQQL